MSSIKRILDVGQCSSDAMRISRLLTTLFDCSIDRAHSPQQALALASANQYDLILVNRLLDHDGSPGLDVITTLHTAHPTTSLMLISDYPEAQAQAIQAGAHPGFGKSSLDSPQTASLLEKALR